MTLEPPPSQGDFDLSNWPLARYRMPDHVPDAEADARARAFDTLLARGERFVLIISGPEVPKDSPRFMKAYKVWFGANRDAQGRLCAGAVRIEPDPARRESLALKALSLLNKDFLLYPFTVVGTATEAEAQAKAWLAA